MARERDRTTTPPQYDVPPPQLPGADYSYTVELVGGIQRELGKLIADVAALKDQAKETAVKLEQVRFDIHGAKSAGKALLWVVGVVGTILGIFLAAYFRQILGVPPHP